MSLLFYACFILAAAMLLTWTALAVVARLKGHTLRKMSVWDLSSIPLLRYGVLAVALVSSTVAYADTTNGPTNSKPRPDIVMDNGAVNGKTFSIDPQIGVAVTAATGATAATTSFTVMKADTTFTSLRGNVVGNSTGGYLIISRSGLYRVEAQCNGAAANGETSTIEIATTVDDSNYTTVSGATASFVALTGALTQGMHAVGYYELTPSAALLGTTHVVVRGKNSAGTLTCKSMNLLTLSRVDTAQPYAYP